MRTIVIFTIALVSWVTVITQLVFTTENLTNFFSYFTILSNVLVMLCSTSLLIPVTNPVRTFFKSTSVQTAIALYIFIVSLVYNAVLRWYFQFEGLQLVIDNLLHVVIPLLYILYWCFYTEKQKLRVKDGLLWLIFPSLYLVYSMVRGNYTHWYPYPFLNVEKSGIEKVATNVLFMIIAFLISALVLILVNNLVVKKKRKQLR